VGAGQWPRRAEQREAGAGGLRELERSGGRRAGGPKRGARRRAEATRWATAGEGTVSQARRCGTRGDRRAMDGAALRADVARPRSEADARSGRRWGSERAGERQRAI
jgi:hypothetical protein